MSAAAHTPLQKYDPSVILHNFKTFDIRKVPCARDAFLHAIGGGLAIGAIRFVRSRFIKSSIDYAIGSFLLIGVVDLYVLCWTSDMAMALIYSIPIHFCM